MMRQFEVSMRGGNRLLFITDMRRYDYWWGFRRFIKELACQN